MTSKSEGPGKGPAKPSSEPSGPKKPAAIIDLKATEVHAKDAPKTASVASATITVVTPVKPAESKGPAATAAGGAAKPAATAAGPAKSADAKPADAKPAAAPAAAKAAPAARSGSSFSLFSAASHMLAGLVGGFLALVGADTISSGLGIGGLMNGSPQPEIQSRLASLEKTVKERSAQAPSDMAQKLALAEAKLGQVDELGRTIKLLGETQAKLAADSRALGEKVGGAGTSEQAARLVKLEETLAALSSAAASDPQKGRIPQLAAITSQIKDLESKLNTELTALRTSVAKELDGRLTQTTEASEAAKAGTQRIDRDVAAVRTDSSKLAQRIDGLKADSDKLAAGLKSAEAATAGLKTAVDGLKSDFAAQLQTVARPQDVGMAIAPISSKLAAVEQSLQGVVKNEEGRRSNAERIVLALELGNLKRAIERGGRFATELAEVQKLGQGKLQLATLEKMKDQGVPTTADLLREFRDVAHAIIEADGEPADASVVERLLTGAKSIVRVRKVATGPDDKSVDAVVSRMEAALKDQRFTDVSAEAKALTPKAAAPAASWLAKIEGRAAVDRAVADVEAQLKASLGAKTQ